MNKTVLAKFNKDGDCEAVYTFNYPVDPLLYPDAEVITDKELKEKIQPMEYKKVGSSIIKMTDDETKDKRKKQYDSVK